MVDGNGTIIQVNRQAENLFGFGRDELLGGPVEVLMPERFHRSHVVQRDAYAADPRLGGPGGGRGAGGGAPRPPAGGGGGGGG
ncbi:MAG: PAS domain S-box protein [Lysobacter sp.]|nr:PAS domain S-box protein [Lysobacter sp.]